MIGNLSYNQFLKYRDFIHKNFGIFYSDSKLSLLQIKLDKCLLKTGINSYTDFFGLISENKEPFITKFINEITVNKTDFFRGIEQFDYIKNNSELILKNNPAILKTKEIKVWSMACSTGEEPYSLAMILKETFSDIKIRILATDVSSRVLKFASEGKYSASAKKEISSVYLKKYFNLNDDTLTIKEELKENIKFRSFNLINPFPFRDKFDIIFCRNVMIYFNNQTQQQTVGKISDCLAPGGLLFLGLSESLVNKKHDFENIRYSIYRKK